MSDERPGNGLHRPITSIPDIVRSRRGSPEQALSFEGTTTSFDELDNRSSRTARALLASGVRFGDRVAYLGKNRPEFFDIVLGASKIGAVCVSINWRLSPREVRHILEDSCATVLFVDLNLDGIVAALGPADLDGITLVGIGRVHHDGNGAAGWPLHADWIADRSPQDPGADAGPDGAILQLYTSGTTGLPKGVVLSNRNFFAMARSAGAAWGFHPGMVGLGVSPLFHISGSGWNLMVMAHGGHVILHREVDAQTILRDIPIHGVTHAILVPTILQMILAQPAELRTDVSTLDTVIYGASPISDSVLLELFDAFDCGFVQGYGLTETSGAVTILAADDHDRSRPELLRSCGRALPGIEIRITDPESGADLPDGEVGEILIRGDQVMTGYWNQPAATAAALTREGFLRTGDAGYIADGLLYINDRVKDMIISGGENIYPAEVENALMRQDAIVDAAVIGVPDERWGESVMAFVVLGAHEELTASQIIERCRHDLAHYKCPRHVEFVSELPRNPSGKVLKTELRRPFWGSNHRQV